MHNKRFETNKEIISKITEFITKYPDMRFGQALVCLELLPKEEYDTPDGVFKKIQDPFYEESTVTLERMRKDL